MRETAKDRRESDAVTNARHRIAQLADTYGIRHPEYATGLNQLALLLIMQGASESAEPLLRTALEIRREMLGERHPDYATNLSSLGGLLWARGEFDQAEPLLRQAVEVRCDTLGPAHPKSVVSMNSLEQLLKAKHDWTGLKLEAEPPAHESVPRPTLSPIQQTVLVPPLITSEPAATVLVEQATPQSVFVTPVHESAGISGRLAARIDELTRRFAELGGHLVRAGELLKAGSVAEVEEFAGSWKSARDEFDCVLGDAKEAAQGLDVAVPPGGLTSLEGVAAILPGLHEAESVRNAFETSRGSALAVLDRVDRLGYPSAPEFAPLAACLDQARSLRVSIERALPRELPVEVVGLNAGVHPLSVLLKLVEADDSADDTNWADWYDAVAGSFGNPLAVAVARSRVVAGRN